MCAPSCVVSTAYVFLNLAIVSCLLAYVAPFWILFPSKFSGFALMPLANLYRSGTFDIARAFWTAGLWGACDKGSDSLHCTWFFANDFYTEKNLPDWHRATQGLFGAGLILLTIGFFLATFNVCCRCCKSSFSIRSVIGSFVITGTICVGIAIGVYGGFMAKDYDVSFDQGSVSFYWGFFVAIAGAAMALVSGILFFCDSCCPRSHTGYQMTRVV